MAENPIPARTSDHSALLRQALRAVEQMQKKLDAAEQRARQPIAIVGMGCRFPGGADDVASFWELLREGREAISEVPAERWNIDEYYDPDPAKPGKMVSRFGGFLTDIDKFDAAFFGIAPREAAMMDPQQRMLLEVTWQALESGAIVPRSLSGSSTGVYLGIASGDYGQMQLHAGDARLLDVHYASGNGHSIASGRLSYLLGLKGPSVSIDTACSSSLVAVHLACQALRAGECSLAIAGGVNAILAPETTVALSQAHMLAPDGRSKAFDVRADGFARAEGCGVIVLKPLAQAVEDGDRVIAIIRGTAVNQDGASSSLTAPNGPAQEELMRRALADAGKTADEIGYVEAHGTGTSLGDPIELRALGGVYGAARRDGDSLHVGSLKTNFGHMEAAAGIGGLIKLVLALEHGEIPAHVGFEAPTPHVPWDRLRLTVARTTTVWPAQEKPRVGAVSSFGFSGTNAHLIVEQGPGVDAPKQDEEILRVLPLSAKSSRALQEVIARYADWMESGEAGSWADVTATAGMGRDHFRHRAAVVASNRAEAAAALRAQGEAGSAVQTQSLGFLFTGQGSERAGMGLELLERSVVFRTAIGRLETGLGNSLGAGIAAIWANVNGELERASFVQPALYAYGWALSELWRSWGVEPRVVLGHSLGEYVAATVAGVMTPEEGIRLVAARGRLTERLGEPGGMVAVVASEEAVRELLVEFGELSVAAVNGPSSVVVSGVLRALDLLEERLRHTGLRHKRLRTTHGFHSAALDGMLDAFEAEAAKIPFKIPEIWWISNLTGQAVERKQPVNAGYWRRHLRETVLFGDGLAAIETAGADVLLEVGAEPQLLALAEGNGVASGRLVASIRKGGGEGEWRKLLTAAGRLYSLGADLDWKGVCEGKPFCKVVLPGYPFERRRFWFTDAVRAAKSHARLELTGDRTANGHPLLGARLRSRSEAVTFHAELSGEWPEHLGDHVVTVRRILPGAAYLEMALAAGYAVEAEGSWSAVEVEFREPCVFDEARLLETVLHPADAGRRRFEIASAGLDAAEGDWTLHVTGFIEAAADAVEGTREDIGSLQERAATVWSGEDFYARMRVAGLEFGPAFCPVIRAWGGASESVVELKLLPEVLAEAGRYGVHPVALDACLQAAAALMDTDEPTAPALPAGVERYQVWGDVAALRYARATVRKRQGRGLTVDVYGLDGDGRRVLEVVGLTLVEAAAHSAAEEFRGWLYEVVWEKLSAAITGEDKQASLEMSRLAERDELREFERWMVEFDALCAAWIAEGFERGGFAPGAGRVFDIDELIGIVGVTPEHRRLVGRFVEILVEFGYVERLEAGRYRALGKTADEGLRVASGLAGAGHPEMDWAARTVGQLLPLLRGEVRAVDALFADGGQDVATRLYRESVMARTLNPVLVSLAAMAVALRGRATRVLEVGGGTAATTSYLVPALRGKIAEYVWTDIGTGFVSAARREFGGVEGMRFQTLDLERDPAEQGLAGELFDVVVASNVVHATADIRETLRHLRSLLRPGGVLLLAETVGRQPWVDLTVGFTDGWWRFTDHDLRPEYTLIGREAWIEVLRETGFGDVALLPGQATGDGALDKQCLISAVADETERAPSKIVIVGAGELAHSLEKLVQRDGAQVTIAAVQDDISDATEIFYLLGTEVTAEEPGDAALTWQERVLGGALGLVQGLLASEKLADCRLWLVSRGAYRPGMIAADGASLAGFARSVRAEYPEARVMAVDLPAKGEVGEGLWRLARRSSTQAVQYVVRGEEILVPRLMLRGLRQAAEFSGFRGDGAYVVTGGFNGLGLATVEWLAGQDAGCVLALGRSEPGIEARASFDRLRGQGTVVISVRCDVSDERQLADALSLVPEGFALRGVFHAAGVLDNAALPNQSAERFRAVLKAKVGGAWNLHRLTRGAELDCFVLFSSVAGVLGARGQANHAAANAYMDALAHFRRERCGLTALSVNWGVWSGTGAAVRHGAVERSERLGAASIAPEAGLRLLGRLLEDGCTQVLASPVNWRKWAEGSRSEAGANADLVGHLIADLRDGAPVRANTVSKGALRVRLVEAPETRRRGLLEARVEEQIRAVLSFPASEAIDPARPLQEYGLDSLLSIELRNALSADLETKLSATALFDYPTMGGLTDWLFDDVLKLTTEPTEQAASKQIRPAEENASWSTQRNESDVLSGVSELTDEEVERLFQLKMAGIEK